MHKNLFCWTRRILQDSFDLVFEVLFLLCYLKSSDYVCMKSQYNAEKVKMTVSEDGIGCYFHKLTHISAAITAARQTPVWKHVTFLGRF